MVDFPMRKYYANPSRYMGIPYGVLTQSKVILGAH